MENNLSNEILEQMARERVKTEKKLYTSIFIYTIGIIVYVSKTYFGAPLNFFPLHHINLFVMLVWTFFIVVQVLKFLFNVTLFGNTWENKKIQKFINQEKIKKQNWE